MYVELFLTLVPGASLVGDPGVRTPAQNHSSSVPQREPSSGRAEQHTRHVSGRPPQWDRFTLWNKVFVNGSFHKTTNRNKTICHTEFAAYIIYINMQFYHFDHNFFVFVLVLKCNSIHKPGETFSVYTRSVRKIRSIGNVIFLKVPLWLLLFRVA